MDDPLLGSEVSRKTMQRTDVSVKLAAFEKGSAGADSAGSAGHVPAEVGVQDNQSCYRSLTLFWPCGSSEKYPHNASWRDLEALTQVQKANSTAKGIRGADAVADGLQVIVQVSCQCY